MITRFQITCPGCESPILVRLGMAPTTGTNFYVPCPECDVPIRGRSTGTELQNHQVTFDAERFTGPEPESWVTIDPNVPSRYRDAELGALGASPNITFMILMGERGPDLSSNLERGRQAVDELWPQTRRLYEYYLAEQWVHFDRAGTAIVGNEWASPNTSHERTTWAHQILGVCLQSMQWDSDDAASRFMQRYLRKHSAAINNPGYVAFLRTEHAAGRLAGLQRAIFDLLDLFIRRHDSWEPGMMRRAIPETSEPDLKDLILFRDEFDILRDLYQQGFELVCKCLALVISAQNSVERGDPHAFGAGSATRTRLEKEPAGQPRKIQRASESRQAAVCRASSGLGRVGGPTGQPSAERDRARIIATRLTVGHDRK